MSSPLHVVRAGTAGPPLILVHGSATDASTWTIQLASPLTSRYRVVAYDRRGAGRSPRAPGVAWHTIEEHAAELAALIAEATAAVDRAIAIAAKLVADDEVNLEWKEALAAGLILRGDLALARGKATAALADADGAVVQSMVAIAKSPESAVWIMLVAEARFLRARAVRAIASQSPTSWGSSARHVASSRVATASGRLTSSDTRNPVA